MTQIEFVKCVEGCQKQVRRFLTALCCGDSMRADDIAQDAFIKAYLSCDSVRDEEKFVRWIHRIAYNTFISSQRVVKTSVPLDELYSIESGNRSDASFKYQELYAALDKLSEKERTAILLFYMEGYDIKEIAEITDSTIDAVKQLLKRGREHLKHILR
ncbi:MAG: RNA polymerase sigma factor [Muribaculaceae bacterium]|nr:RNA polymerase sigma factor [Muribaculaceae bacterium]